MRNKLTLQSDIKNLIKVETLIDDLSQKLDLSNQVYGNILISVIEAANNAILHGNKQKRDKDIEIEYSYNGENIKFRVKDSGEGFDFNNTPDPTSPENIKNPYGRGIFLMKQLADKVEYSDEGRCVELIFNI